MKINDLERETGLDRATIRYYEKEGLIAPQRLDNGYREYSQEEKDQLLKIRLLRQLGMSLDRIRKLQQGSEAFSDALEDQLSFLEACMQAADRAKAVCKEMRISGVPFETLDAKFYLEMLDQPAIEAPVSVETTKPNRMIWEEYHPVRRFVARMLDYTLIRFILMFFCIVVLRVRPYGDFLSNAVNYGSAFLAVPILALFLSLFGTTPGKWVMGLGVVHFKGYRMDFAAALQREWEVLRYGYGFGIPFWSVWRLYRSYRDCAGTPMDWDIQNQYVYHIWDVKKKLSMAIAILLVIALPTASIFDYAKPRNRGDITVAEFAENYNGYLKMISDPDESQLMKEDGTWPERTTNPGNAVVILGSKSEGNDFVYETEGDYIRKITYDNTWTEIMMCDPLGSSVQLAAFSILMSQRGSNYFDLLELGEMWEAQAMEENGHLQHEYIEIKWNITATNCIYTSAGYITQNESMPSSVKLHFEIIVK